MKDDKRFQAVSTFFVILFLIGNHLCILPRRHFTFIHVLHVSWLSGSSVPYRVYCNAFVVGTTNHSPCAVPRGGAALRRMISGSTSIIVPNIRFLVTSAVFLLPDKIANAVVIKIIRKIIGVYQEGLIIPIQSPDHVTGMSVCLLRFCVRGLKSVSIGENYTYTSLFRWIISQTSRCITSMS